KAVDLAAFEDFYRQADIRSGKMVANLSLENSSPEFRARALVCGGFHAPQIAQLFRQQKIPYAIVSPKLTKIDDNSGSAYLSVFAREHTPLEQLFQGEKLFLAPQKLQIADPETALAQLAVDTSLLTRLQDVTVIFLRRAYSLHVEFMSENVPSSAVVTPTTMQRLSTFFEFFKGRLPWTKTAKSANNSN